MSPERFQRARELFEHAIELPESDRSAFVARQCGDDRELSTIVHALLQRARLQQAENAENPPIAAGDRLIGAQVGPYRIRAAIGQGGMGAVYEAEHERTGQVVALKLVRPGLATPALLQRFEFELQVLARLEHPGIARIYHADTADVGGGPQPYFAMELVRGQNLTTFATEHKLSIRQRLELAARIADAVQYAHQQGVIHRDLKPGNIFVSADGQPKILDFGVARATDSDVQSTTLQTDIGQLIGTLPYMSPEQAGGDPNQIDTRSDVYALGVVIYELLTGRLPYLLQQKMVLEVVRIIKTEEPTRLSSLNRTLRGDVETIVGKALEKDKTRRYPTANALANDIRRYLNDEPITARPPSATYQIGKFAQRNKILVGGVAATFLVLVAGLITASGLLQRAWAAEESAENNAREAKAETRRAEEALTAEERQRQLAARRAAETQQVADFQARMLSDVDVEAMGIGIKHRFREQVRAALERHYLGEYPNRRKYTDEEVRSELAEYDNRAAAVQSVDVARAVLDEFLLSPARSSARATFHAQPLVHAQLLDALANVYLRLGRPTEAEICLRDASSLVAAELGDESPVVLALGNALALSLCQQATYAEAETLARRVLTIRRRSPEASPIDVAASLETLGQILRRKGDHANAEQLVREALSIYRENFDSDHIRLASSLKELATLLQEKGEYSAAEAYFREILAISVRLHGEEHPDVALRFNDLAFVLKEQGQYEASEQMYRRAIELHRRFHGDEHNETLGSRSNLAVVLRLQGKFDEAEYELRDVVALSRRIYGEYQGGTVTRISNLAGLLRERQDLGTAEALFREALAINLRLYGETHSRVAGSLQNLATVLMDRRELASAELLLQEAVEIDRKVNGPQHPDLASSLINLGALRFAKEAFADAESSFREAVEIALARLPETERRSVLSLTGLGTTLVRRLEDPSLNEQQRKQYRQEAESRLSAAWRGLAVNPMLVRSREKVLASFVTLYDDWNAAEPGQGYDAKVAKWREELTEWRATTRPTTARSASAPTSTSQPVP